MSKEILINIEPQEKRVAITNQGRLEEFYIERPQDKTIVGNIYKGKIDAILPSLGAAFVDIGLPQKGQRGFLYLSELEFAFEAADMPKNLNPTQIKKGQEILVQVVKESFGRKGPRLSTHIGLAGRYLVLLPEDNRIGVSRRIEEETERIRLREILTELKLPKDVGFIVRTAASGKSKQELMRDVNFLLKLWRRLKKLIVHKKAPYLIYEEYDLVFRVIRDSFTDDVIRLYVDSKEEYYRIIRFMKTFMGYLIDRVYLYEGSDLFMEKNVERQINRIFETKIYLKSKAYIVIEPTEGLVVIDVNSGGFKKKLDQEEMAFRVNCEAAEEIARQLILRDLGGIIVIDFIDMEKEAHRREVLNILKRSLRNDRAKYDILGISRFGLVEMTRERIHRTADVLSYQPCPYCSGRGKVKSALTMAIYVFRELRRLLKTQPQKEVTVSLNPVVIDEVLKDKESLRLLENRFKAKINLVSNPSLHIEDFKVS
ncbi:MAG: Rne/Rng family ribonuclease [Candidatus Omnitrophica bacterium]|nr:Rne/Rng family ribonuclease [Candidatus Omnitrophota bacterium]